MATPGGTRRRLLKREVFLWFFHYSAEILDFGLFSMIKNYENIKSVSYLDDKPIEEKPAPKLPDYNRRKTKICHEPRISLLSSENNWDDYSGSGLKICQN